MRAVFQILSLRYLRQRWTRSALIVLSIALGVATLVSTRILNRCIEVAAAETTTPMGLGDLYVGNGEIGVERMIADEIRAANVPGVQSVQPVVIERATLPQFQNKNAVLLGIDLASHQLPADTKPVELLSRKKIVEVLNGKNALKAQFEEAELSVSALWKARNRSWIVLSEKLYNEWVATRVSDDAPYLLRYGGRNLECTPMLVVKVSPESPLAGLGPNLVGMEIDCAAGFVRPGHPRINRIDIILSPGANRDAVKAQIAVIAGDRAGVRTPEDQGRSTQEIIGGIQIGFTLCSVGAMVVGLFLVYNALSVTVTERRHDIGILRSLGATRFQILSIFAVAAVVLGLIGGLFGIPLGIGMARFALDLIKDEMASMFTNGEINPNWPSLNTVLLAFGAGGATALLAALVPAIQAAYQDPADVVRRTPGGASGGWQNAHRAICATLVAGGFAMILTREELPARVGAFGGMVCALVGLLLAMPIFVALTVRAVQPILRAILPIEARLAADNLIRSPGRTGLVIGALAAGVAVMIQTAGVGRSNEEPVTRWLDEVIQADQFIAAGNVTEAVSSMCPLDPQVLDDLHKVPGVENVAGLRYVRPEYKGTLVFLTAIDLDQFINASQARSPDGLPHLDKFRKLRHAEGVVMSDNFARRHGVNIGDTVTLSGPRGPIKLKVLEMVSDYSWSRGTLFIDREVYARLFEDNLIDIAHVFVTQESDEARLAARERVNQFAADRGFITADRKALRKMLGELIERIYKLVHLQQIVIGVVASLGVITSLLISVLQRKRELGLLLAIGATPSQVIGTVLAEAVLMGLFGTALGILMGIPLEWYVLRVVLFEESGFSFELLLPWKQVLCIAGGALLVATLAGLLPAMRAVKTPIPEAIAYE
jgi:putative ABC transport system permease protein